MAEKVYGFYNNKCREEVVSKEEYDSQVNDHKDAIASLEKKESTLEDEIKKLKSRVKTLEDEAGTGTIT